MDISNKGNDDTSCKSQVKSIVRLRWIVFLLSVLFITFVFIIVYSLLVQRNLDKENARMTAELYERMKSLTDTNAQLVFEIEQISVIQRNGSPVDSKEELWQQKYDSIKQLSFYNSMMNHMNNLNESTLCKVREENQRLYDNYLTHINSILVFFSIIIAVISVFVPYLINRKTDDIIKDHDTKLNEITNQIVKTAEEAAESTDQNIAVSQIAYYTNMASTYEVKGEYDRALEYYMRALELRKSKLGDNHRDMALIYNNIAVVYEDKREYMQSLDYFLKALKIFLNSDNLTDAVLYYENMYLCYEDAGINMPFEQWMKEHLNDKEWASFLKLAEYVKDRK